jgi:hypothetical protein
MLNDYNQLKALIASIEDDINKAAAGNKAAGTRVRKAMQEVKNLSQTIRVAVLATREETGEAPGSGPAGSAPAAPK